MNADKIRVELSDACFHSYHGVFPQEREVGNEFRVDISVEYPVPAEFSDSNLDNILSYADLFDIAEEEMSKPRNLLESVAISITKRIEEKWPQSKRIRVRIEKKNPPIPRLTGSASAEIIHEA